MTATEQIKNSLSVGILNSMDVIYVWPLGETVALFRAVNIEEVDGH